MIREYIDISENILLLLKQEEVNDIKIKKYFNKRQKIIDLLDENELKNFVHLYESNKIYEIDDEIKTRLENEILKVKKDIVEYKKTKIVNSAYININKKNLNIFSKKV